MGTIYQATIGRIADIGNPTKSPYIHLKHSRQVPVYVAHGIHDNLVFPSLFFNALAKTEYPMEDMFYISEHNRLPPHINVMTSGSFFCNNDPDVKLIKESGNVRMGAGRCRTLHGL